KAMQFLWAFRQVQPTRFVSFHPPPREVADKHGIRPAGAVLIDYLGHIDGVPAANLVPELIRKSLLVRCRQQGLRFCNDRELFYFPSGLLTGDRLTYCCPGGKASWLTTVGERTFGKGSGKSTSHYALAPTFYVHDEPRVNAYSEGRNNVGWPT